MAAQEPILFIIYAPALISDESRTLAVVHGMERALPGLRLEWRVSDGGQPIPLPHRDAWLAKEARQGMFPLLCNGDESYPIMISGLEYPMGVAPGGLPLNDVHIEIPLDEATIPAVAKVLEEVAEGARAVWSQATPDSAAEDIALQTAPTLEGPPRPPRGLPTLKIPEHIRSPEIPHYLGWLNYWSAATAQALGFPNPSRDADLISRSRRTASGGWVIRLTEAPLDLDNPAHLNELLRAYERFPEIGGRANGAE